MSELDLDLVRHALSLARAHGFAEVELSLGADSFTARLAPGAPAPVATSPAAVATAADPEVVAIKANHVGYYKPGESPLAPGQTVAKGDVVATIAALGLANDVESTVSGEVVEVLVEADQPVEYGQTIALVKKG